MKPTLTTPDTLRLMLFAVDVRSVCVCGYTDWDGAYHPLLGLAAGRPWAALAQAVEGTKHLRASHCLVVSNVAEVVDAISPHLRLNLDIWDIDAHREAISLLSVRYGGHCAALLAEAMPKTEETWKQCYSPQPAWTTPACA